METLYAGIRMDADIARLSIAVAARHRAPQGWHCLREGKDCTGAKGEDA